MNETNPPTVISFALEVAWTRMLGLVLDTSIYAFVTMLSMVLIGIAVGSALATPLVRRHEAMVREIRGKGLMIGVRFDSGETAEAVQWACFERGLLVLEVDASWEPIRPGDVILRANGMRVYGIDRLRRELDPRQENTVEVLRKGRSLTLTIAARDR